MDKNKLNASIGKSYPYEEKVSGKKFLSGMFSFLNPVLWLKDISSIFNIRKIIIVLLIIAGFFSYGYFKGTGNRPVSVKLRYGKEAYINLNGENLHIDKNGNVYLEDSKGNILKQIKAKDMKGLRGRLAPLNLQLKPFILAGYGTGLTGDSSMEFGGGVSFFRIWKANVDAFLTNKGAYGGVSYKLTDNSGIGAGVGRGWKGDSRGIIYYKFEF